MSLRNLCIVAFSLVTYFVKSQGFTVTEKIYQPDCSFNSVKLIVMGNTPPYKYKWGNGATSDSISNIKESVVLAVQITDSLGKDTTLAFVVPAPACGVSFPNHFTPNGDGIHDTWIDDNNTISRYPDFLLEVYDRWGQLVHTQRHYYTPWDGTQLGLKLPDATYYYIFFYDRGDASNYVKGSVTIVR